jgi:anaerobic ribonucleoside-triphosphate reductase activating protein
VLPSAPSTTGSKRNSDLLNVAATVSQTRALGPGIRAVVWVQGCPFKCPDCIAPDWISFNKQNLIKPEVLAEELLSNPLVTGFTFSGGEPFAQAAPLTRLATHARKLRDIDILCYTGFLLDELITYPPYPGTKDLLDQVDVLIDGPYQPELNNGVGLRGSSNQRIHHLTCRMADFPFEESPRRVEFQILESSSMLIGIPKKPFLSIMEKAEQIVNEQIPPGADHERS